MMRLHRPLAGSILILGLSLAAAYKEPKASGYVKYETKVTIKGKPRRLVLAR